MLEKFDEIKRERIVSFSQTVYDIEHGTVNQRNLNDFYNEDVEYYRDELQVLNFWDNAEKIDCSNLARLKEYICEVCPRMEEAYLPFAIKDLLQEAYEANIKEDESDGQ